MQVVGVAQIPPLVVHSPGRLLDVMSGHDAGADQPAQPPHRFTLCTRDCLSVGCTLLPI